jgi:hypothetical protein
MPGQHRLDAAGEWTPDELLVDEPFVFALASGVLAASTARRRTSAVMTTSAFCRHRRDDPSVFTLLRAPGLDATNWRAELASRFGVILRKVWGGNRTWAGARAQSVLMSVWRTCWQ